MPESIEVAAYYVVAEALTNATKHAQASEVSVSAVAADDELHITITDDGIGGAVTGAGSGLIGLKDRVMHQITSEGENEDPSYAPDGRHMSITRRLGAIGDQRNIWVLDKKTGRLRQLTQSGDARLSDWSPPLKAAF